MTVIDVHAHIYPEKIAERAVDAVGEFYLVDMYGKGTATHLLESQKRAPISRFVVHSVATSTHAVTAINDFIAAQCREHAEFIGFMAMHQDFPDPEAEIERAIGLGLVGMKLHPDTQEVDMDDPRLMRVYEMIEGRMPLIVHTGDYRTDFSHPRRLKHILRAFPNLVVDAAHFGGWQSWERSYAHVQPENVFYDTSSSLQFLGKERALDYLDKLGAHRFLFGTDFPMWTPQEELQRFLDLGLDTSTQEAILHGNFERLFSL